MNTWTLNDTETPAVASETAWPPTRVVAGASVLGATSRGNGLPLTWYDCINAFDGMTDILGYGGIAHWNRIVVPMLPFIASKISASVCWNRVKLPVLWPDIESHWLIISELSICNRDNQGIESQGELQSDLQSNGGGIQNIERIKDRKLPKVWRDLFYSAT